MIYVIRGWYDDKATGSITVEAQTRADALERALTLKSQGPRRVTVTDATGREFSPAEFEEFCAGSEDFQREDRDREALRS